MSESEGHRLLFPLFLDLARRTVLVVGGGAVASRKVQELLDAGAHVSVVAPRISEELVALAAEGKHVLTLEPRPFEDRDVRGAWLVIAATDDDGAQAAVAAACESAHVFCVAVDDPKNASAYGGGVVRRGPVTIAISTSGEAPALARLIREVVEEMLPDQGFVEAARELRAKWKSEKTPMGSRFAELVRAFKERAQ